MLTKAPSPGLSPRSDAPPTPSGPREELAGHTLAMPADTNPARDIFGGWILSLLDPTGALLPGPHSTLRCADPWP